MEYKLRHVSFLKWRSFLFRRVSSQYFLQILSSFAFAFTNMTYNVAIVPASSKAGENAIRYLLETDTKVYIRAIYRNTSKAPADFLKHANFEAVKGDVSDGDSLNFAGSDAVLFNQPPTYDGTDLGEFATKTATNMKNALVAGGVKKLVILSALGAQHSSGIVSSPGGVACVSNDKLIVGRAFFALITSVTKS